jgi:ABC-type lipoprotein export system ATPase subunit
MSLLEVRDLKKSYVSPDGVRQPVIDIPEFSVAPEAQVAICGRSGSGKTTLLHLIAGILVPDSGCVTVAGTPVSQLNEPERDRFRARYIGYIFQTFNLLPSFSCLENVLLSMSFGAGENRKIATELLRRVGLENKIDFVPRQLSTGQQQRVAIARALANHPKLVLADEPTGNLDAANAREAIGLIRETCREQGAALLLVSHDRQVLNQFETVLDFERFNLASSPREVSA